MYANYPDGLAAVVKRALARNVNERFQTAAEFRDALEHYLKDEHTMVSPAGVGQLVRRVLGSRIEQQRQALREALVAADGTIVNGLVPEQSATVERSSPGVSSPRIGVPSEPPTSTSQYSNSRTGTPRPQTLDGAQARRAGFLPLFAAVGGLAAAASSIFWVTHRAAPTPLITTHLANTAHLAPSGAPRDDSEAPVGVNVDTLPIAGGNTPEGANADAISNALTGHKPPAAAAPALPARPGASKDSKDDSALPENPYKASKEPAPAAPAPAAPAPDPAPGSGDSARRALTAEPRRCVGCARLGRVGCCRVQASDGPSGAGSASVTFSPDGPVKAVTVSAPFAGTPGRSVRGHRVPRRARAPLHG